VLLRHLIEDRRAPAAGVTQLTRMPVCDSAQRFGEVITAALDALYAEAFGLPSFPATIYERPLFFCAADRCAVHRNAAH
jgi:hypothetical protein